MSESPPRSRGTALIVALCAGHVFSDFYATVFPPLLVQFRRHFDVSLTEISWVVALSTIFASGLQPFMGLVADRVNKLALAGAGILCSAVFMSSIGFAPSVWSLAALLAVGGLGVAAFHPTGAALASAAMPSRSNMVMGLFLTGGTLGLMLSPIVVTHVVSRTDMTPLWKIGPPGIVVGSALLWFAVRRRPGHERPGAAHDGHRRSLLRDLWSTLRPFFSRSMLTFWWLFAIAAIRAAVFVAFTTYISVVGKGRGWYKEEVGYALSWVFFCTMLGSLIGGRLAERVSQKALLACASLFSLPLFCAYALCRGPTSLVALGEAGFIFSLGTPLNIVMAQRVRPESTSTISGMMMGFAWAAAGLFLPVVAYVEKHTRDMELTLSAVSLGLVVASVLAACVPIRGDGSQS